MVAPVTRPPLPAAPKPPLDRPAPTDRRLSTIVRAVGSASASITADQAWFAELVGWLFDHDVATWFWPSQRTARLRRLVQELEKPDTGTALTERIRRVWMHESAVRFFAETGLSERTSFVAEALRRTANHVLPRVGFRDDLLALVERLDLRVADADWIASLPSELTAPWGRLLRPSSTAVGAAAELVAVRAAAVGLSRDILSLQPIDWELESPFFRLARIVSECAEAAERHDGAWPDRYAAWQRCREHCHASLTALDQKLEERGVSTDLVFRRELLDAQLARIGALFELEAGTLDGQAFAARLVRQSAEQRSVRGLVRVTLRRLARKVIEHTGKTGEHYVVRTRRDWWATARAAAGGGSLTVFTALVGFGIAALPLAPMVTGLALAADDGASFLTMQACRLTLASKQPSVTASALAGALEKEHRVDEVVDLVAAITRCQVIATMCNVLFSVPIGIGIALVWQLLSGHAVLSADTATQTIASLDPVRSGALLFAALTGLYLWASSMADGWTANWSAYRQFPQALADSPRVQRVLRPERARKLGAILDRHIGGIAGNLTLGFLMGFTPVLFAFMGLGLQVRHVTLSSASLGLALGSQILDRHVALPPLVWAALGIVGIGALNFGLSFVLALRVAARARGLDAQQRQAVWREVLRAARARPGRFLWAPRAQGASR
jgi:site-specific recombinase